MELKKEKKEKEKIRLNDRDKELFRLLSKHRFLTLELIFEKFEPEELPLKRTQLPSFYYRLYRLVQAGYLHTIKKQGMTVYLLARKGLETISQEGQDNEDLSLPSLSELTTLDHDLACARIRFYFEHRKVARWITERELRRKGEGKPKIPDGAFQEKNKVVFVEIQFSQKSFNRYREIYDYYARPQGGPDFVLYFYRARSVIEGLITLSENNPRFFFFPLPQPLPPPDHWIGSRCREAVSLQEVMKNELGI